MRINTVGCYVGDHDGLHPRLWFDPAGNGARIRLETLNRTSPDGPHWGYRGSGPNATTEAILFHATGDMTVVEMCGPDFANDIVAGLPFNQPFQLPALTVSRWLLDHGVDLAPPWGPTGTTPVIRSVPPHVGEECYAVVLDGWDVLTIDLYPDGERARICVRDLDDRDRPAFAQTITYAYPDETGQPPPWLSRVVAEELPFGGWMITANRNDLVALDRDRGQPDRLHVQVVDRTHAPDEFAFDQSVRHRYLPAHSRALTAADRLRRFTPAPTPTTERSITR